MAGQLGLPDRGSGADLQRAAGRHLRQEVDAQAAGYRQGGQSGRYVGLLALSEPRLPDVADRSGRDRDRRRFDRPGNQDFRRQAVHHQRSGHLGQHACGRRGDPPRALYAAGRALRPLDADADHPDAQRYGSLQPRDADAGHQARLQRAGERQLAAGGAGERPVQRSRRLGLGNLRGFGGHHAQQPFDPQLLQEGGLAPLSDGTEPASLDLGPDQRHLLQGHGLEFYRPLAGRPQAQFFHHLRPLVGAEQRLLFLADLDALFPLDGSFGRTGQAPYVA